MANEKQNRNREGGEGELGTGTRFASDIGEVLEELT